MSEYLSGHRSGGEIAFFQSHSGCIATEARNTSPGILREEMNLSRARFSEKKFRELCQKNRHEWR
jgi:hypothetical protein